MHSWAYMPEPKNQTNEQTNKENFGNGTDYQMCVCVCAAEGFWEVKFDWK